MTIQKMSDPPKTIPKELNAKVDIQIDPIQSMKKLSEKKAWL